jgi:hypothetical protein
MRTSNTNPIPRPRRRRPLGPRQSASCRGKICTWLDIEDMSKILNIGASAPKRYQCPTTAASRNQRSPGCEPGASLLMSALRREPTPHLMGDYFPIYEKPTALHLSRHSPPSRPSSMRSTTPTSTVSANRDAVAISPAGAGLPIHSQCR